jgi:hypothetical protein
MKKIIFLSSTLTILIFSCKQKPKDSYTIEGNVSGLKAPYIYLQKMQGDSMQLDSSKVTDGKFSFKGSIAEPSFAALFIKEPQAFRQFVLENADIKINGKVDSLNKSVVTGAPTQQEMVSYNASIKSLTSQSDSINKLRMAAYEKKDTSSENILKPQAKEVSDKSLITLIVLQAFYCCPIMLRFWNRQLPKNCLKAWTLLIKTQ